MARTSGRSRRAIVPLGATLAVLTIAATAYAITDARLASSRPATAAAAAPSTTTPVKPTPKTSPSVLPPSATTTSAPSPYLGRIGSTTSSTPSAVDTIAVTPAQTGGTLVTTVLLLGTASGTPQVTDSEGNTYQLQDNQADATGDTLLTFTAADVRGLTTADTVSVAYPAATAHAVAIDEYAGHPAVDQSISATGIGSTVSTGKTAKTGATDELAVAALADTSGDVALNEYTPLPSLNVAGATVTIGWRALTKPGTYQATGSSAGPWMAALLTLR